MYTIPPYVNAEWIGICDKVKVYHSPQKCDVAQSISVAYIMDFLIKANFS